MLGLSRIKKTVSCKIKVRSHMRMSQVIFSSFFFLTLVVTQRQLTVFKSKWQCFPQTATGSPREPRSLIDSDVFFESLLKFFIHQADRSLGA